MAALYEQGKVHHVGAFAALEDQMCNFVTDYERGKGNSPDRVDVLVWALTELMVEGGAGWGMLEYYRRLYEKTKEGGDPGKAKEPAPKVTLRAPQPAPSHVRTLSGRMVAVRADGTVEVSEEDAEPLIAVGWIRTDADLKASAYGAPLG